MRSIRLLGTFLSMCLAMVLLVATAGSAGASVASSAADKADPSSQVTAQQTDQQLKRIEALTPQELKQLGESQAAQQKNAKGSTEMQPAWGWPSHTFSHSTTVRIWKAVKNGGVASAAGVCAVFMPAGPVGKALAAGGCAVVASFLASYATIPSNKCVNVNLRLSTKLVTC